MFGEGLTAGMSTNTKPGGRNISCCLGSCQHFCPSCPATASCPLPTATAKEPKAPTPAGRLCKAREATRGLHQCVSVWTQRRRGESFTKLSSSIYSPLSWECVFCTFAFLKCPSKKVHKMMVIDDGSFCCVLNVLTWKNLKITQLCPFTQCLF